jgi:predicted DNA binding CopG/RHH family protein
MKLDEYEKELLSHEDQLLEKAAKPSKELKASFQRAARETIAKDKRINIRISSRDLVALKRKANRYGMPYQTLISSVLHRYLTGELEEKALSNK